MAGFGKYRVFSDWRHDNFRGKVTLAYGDSDEMVILKEWIGDKDQRIGEYIWISLDNKNIESSDERIL